MYICFHCVPWPLKKKKKVLERQTHKLTFGDFMFLHNLLTKIVLKIVAFSTSSAKETQPNSKMKDRKCFATRK